MMTNIDWQLTATAITAFVALYGAGLSTYNLYVRLRENRRHVKVTLKWGMAGIPGNTTTAFFLDAANPGKRTVTLKGCHIVLPNKYKLIMPYPQGDVEFPHTLEEGKSCTVIYPLGEVVQLLMNEGHTGDIAIYAAYVDAIGTTYKSTVFKGNVSEWAKCCK